jgi:diketogulonate reductase-like aldo/keto reductase
VFTKRNFTITKISNPSRIDENKLVFDFEISAEDMQTINQMPYCGGSGLDPDQVDF